MPSSCRRLAFAKLNRVVISGNRTDRGPAVEAAGKTESAANLRVGSYVELVVLVAANTERLRVASLLVTGKLEGLVTDSKRLLEVLGKKSEVDEVPTKGGRLVIEDLAVRADGRDLDL